MTCEVVILNKNAIALAADSAVTVTQWTGNNEERRYYKSVNKLFQLSREHPVGIMIYGSSNLSGVPWELLIKEYRKNLASNSFKKLEEYGEGLFDFINNARKIFPESSLSNIFIESCTDLAYNILYGDISQEENYKKIDNIADKKNFANNFLEDISQFLEQQSINNGFNQDDINKALKDHLLTITEKLSPLSEYIDTEKLSSVAIKANYKTTEEKRGSGIVIAGFGEDEYFPSYIQYECFGNVLGKVSFKLSEHTDINTERPAHIKAFATTNMVNTFLMGVGPDTYHHAGEIFEHSLKNIIQEIAPNISLLDLTSKVEEEKTKFRNNFLRKSQSENYQPLRRVLESLPLEDMAHLAENLIALESLKEKVTTPTESVGGDIDVAVITKHEGMIWMKRKHYFKPELNQRYFKRENS